MATTVETIANKRIIAIDESDSLRHAIEIMIREDIGSVVVNSGGLPKGIITERDLMRKAILQEIDLGKTPARDLMSSPLITVPAGSSLGEAATLMFDKKIRRLLVEKDGKIIGIFTQRDLESATLDYFLAVSRIA